MHKLFFFLAALTLSEADPLYESASRKLDSISLRQAPHGSVVIFTAAEINAWARVKVPETVPQGIRDPRVELGSGTANGYAVVDLLKMHPASNWLMQKLIEGERPLKVTTRVESAGGRCTVYLTRVELSGIGANGTVLDFLIKTFFMPLYPDAKINEPFDLDYDIDAIDVTPAEIRVTIKK